MSHILLADDDEVLSDLLAEYLRSQSIQVTQVMDGQSAVEALPGQHIDLVILDVMMPRMDGFEALRVIRQQSQVPVLMLTARGEDVDRIVGLEMGADDYLPKPCNPRELLARIRAILRRVEPVGNDESDQMIEVGDLVMNLADRSVSQAGNAITLTMAEFNMLAALLKKSGSIVTKEELTEKGLARKLELFDRSVDMHISNLRKKLGQAATGGQRIKTIRGIGYMYAVDQGAETGAV